MQGQLRGEPLTFVIETECAHCKEPLHLELDTDLICRVVEAGAEHVVLVPMVDFEKLEDPSIMPT